MAKSREQDTGIKCEVNGQILDSCGKLMQTIKVLIIKSRDLQKEIVAQGRVRLTSKEYPSIIFACIGHSKCTRILYEKSQMDRGITLCCKKCGS